MGAAASTAAVRESRVIRLSGTSGSTSDSLNGENGETNNTATTTTADPDTGKAESALDKEHSTAGQSVKSSDTETDTQQERENNISCLKREKSEWRKGIDFGQNSVENLKETFSNWDSGKADELLECLLQFSVLYSKLGNKNDRKQRFCKRELGSEMVRAGAIDIMCDICVRILNRANRGKDIPLNEFQILDEALVNVLNLTDESVDVSERVFQKEGVLEALAECMVCRDMASWEGAHNLIGIIYNCSRRPSNKDRLRSIGFTWMLRRLLLIDDNLKLFLVSVALAGILTDEESKLFQTDDRAIRVTLQLFKQTLTSSDHRFNGLSSHELAEATSRLGISDSSKKLLLDVGFLVPLQKLCQKGDVEEQAEGLSAIWTLAFHKDVREAILSQKGLVDILISLKKSPDEAVRTKAANILWTLREDLRSSTVPNFKAIGEKLCRKPVKEKNDSSDSGRHIMISYQWLVKKEAIFRLHETLEEHGYRVWIDRQEMKGSMTDAMALAVEESDVFLMCISQNYKQSDNCRAEAEYAYFHKKHIIPILMDSKYVADGWLGLIKGLKKHYDFSDEEFFDVMFEDLLKEIGGKGKGAKSNQPIVLSGSNSQSGHGGLPVSGVPNWTQERVRQWLHETECHGKSLQNLTGKQLMFLKQLKKEAPEYFYYFLETKIKLRDIDQLTAFVAALSSIR